MVSITLYMYVGYLKTQEYRGGQCKTPEYRGRVREKIMGYFLSKKTNQVLMRESFPV